MPYDQSVVMSSIAIKYHTATKLKTELGWTEKLITEYLTKADKQATNPHNPKAAPMRLYLAERVDSAKNTNPELKRILESNIIKYRARNRDRRAEQKLSDPQLMARAAGMTVNIINLPTNDLSTLIQMAIESRNVYVVQNYQIRNLDNIDPNSLDARIQTVHMIRHDYTNYHDLLLQMPQVGREDIDRKIYIDIRTRILQAIASEIPGLTDACKLMISDMEYI